MADGIGAVSLRDIAARANITHPGLLRHYSSKDALLGAVVDRLDIANSEWLESELTPTDPLGFASLARHNATVPGYLALYSALSGEATSSSHAAHRHMQERYARVRSEVTAALTTSPVRPGLDPRTYATLLIAAWDGVQLQERYAPDEVDVIAQLERHERWLMGSPRRVTAADRLPPEPLDRIEAELARGADLSGTVDSERMKRIVTSAAELFARDGFHGTSLRGVAERVGISKSTLLHHVGSKDALLIAVLQQRDRLTTMRLPRSSASARLLALADAAERAARTAPGLLELYAVLSCEGSAPGHPAHEYFRRRFDLLRRYLTALLFAVQDEGALHPDRDPRDEAAWLVATWDGLQIQWLYDRSIDVARHLRVHFADLRDSG